ncbi:MAG: Ig-like domain-containing protein, partial [Bradyrhizobium sp.]|nr:Ig-like domain-containing protein [Bradyrhizobium sp.]
MSNLTTTPLLSASDKLLDMSGDGSIISYIDTSGGNELLYALNVNSGQTALIDSSSSITGGILSSNGRYLFYGTGDSKYFIRDLQSASPPVDITSSVLPPLTPGTFPIPSTEGITPKAIADDGQTIAFWQSVVDYNNSANSFDGDVVQNLATGSQHKFPTLTAGYEGSPISLTPDGRYFGHTLGISATYIVTDLQSNTQITLLDDQAPVAAGAVSSSGRYIVYLQVTLQPDGSVVEQIAVHDRNASPFAQDAIVTKAPDGTLGNGGSTILGLSGDGRHVLFESSASNLVAGDTDGVSDLFSADLDTGAIELVQRNFSGAAFISSDGSRIIFQNSNGGNVEITRYQPPTLTVNSLPYVNAAGGSTVTVSGISDAIGDTVYLSIPNVSNPLFHNGQAVVQANGAWSATLSVAGLGDGAFDVHATVSDDVNLSTSTDRAFTIDRTPPTHVAIVSVAGDNIINAAERTHAAVVVTAEIDDPAGAGLVAGQLQIKIDQGQTTTVATLPNTTAFAQSYTQTIDASGVADGEHTVTLTAIDEAGNKTVVTKQVLIDTTPPKIAITSVSSDNVVDVGEVKTPQGVKGTSDAIGQTVNVLIDGVQAGQAVVQADGTWLTTINFAGVSTGNHDVTAEVADEAGNPGRVDAGVYVDQGFSVQQLSDGPDGEQGGGKGVLFPGLSADGTKLVFTGLNFNLMSTATGSSGAQVYVKDLTTGAISFVTTDPSQNAEFAAISPDGRYVTFVSDADLGSASPYYTPGLYFTFTKDLSTGATYFHYVSDTGYDSTDPDTYDSGITSAYYDMGNYAEGTPIAALPVFPLAIANNGNALELVDNLEPDQVVQPIVMITQIREIVDYTGTDADGGPLAGGVAYVSPEASPPIENPSSGSILQEYAPQMSADGSVVAFEALFYPDQWDTSTYPPPVTVGAATVPEIYAGTIAYDPNNVGSNPPLALASSFADGTPMPFGAVDPALSSDGKFVAFWSWGKDGALEVYVKNLATGELKVASSDAHGNPGVNNASGTFAGGFNTIAISADGRYVAFTSDAILTPDDSGTGADLFLKDMQTGSIVRVPLPAGTFSQDLSTQLTMRADGQYVAFVTSAGLSPMDRNNTSDVYGISFASLGTTPTIAIAPVAGDNRLGAAGISKQLKVSGTSDAIGRSVSLFVDGYQAFTATVAADGTWSGVIDATSLIDGTHQVRATVVNATGATNSAGDILTVDRVAPSVVLTSDKTHLGAGQTATITATFSEGIGNLQANFFSVSGGSLSQIQFTNDHTVTALFTPNAGATTFSVTANPATAFDYAGNSNTVGASLTAGIGFDGYIVGATVRYANGSGGGVTATTDTSGHFSLSGGDGALVMTGGVDSATGLSFTGTYTAPAGSTILSPLTTLVETLVETTAGTVSAANAAVVAALGLPAGTDLTTLDAVAGALSGDATSTGAFVAGSDLYDAIALIAAAGGSTSGAFAAFAADVASGRPLDLTDFATVAAAATAANLDSTAAAAIASIVAATGSQLALQLASAATPEAVFIDVTGADIAEQSNASTAIGTATQAGTSLSQVADTFTAGLSGILAAADAIAAQNLAAAGYFETPPPVVTAPADITVEATSAAGAVVDFKATDVDTVDGSDPIVYSRQPGSTFAVGKTTVVASATDSAGLTGTASFVVNVVDTNPPVITPPADITVEATSSAGAVVNFTATDVDTVDGSDPISYSRQPGSTFAIGKTTVVASATDSAGNTGTASFVVTVVDTTPPAAPGVALARDTGLSSSDRITADAHLTITGQEPDALLAYSVDGGVASATYDPAILADGAHSVSVTQTDLAGNVSAASSISFTLETAAPAAPQIALTNDSGTSANDHLTNDDRLTLAGLAVGATLSYVVDGVVASTYEPAALADGFHTVAVTQTDPAGNVSAPASLTFTLDRVAPTVAITSKSGLVGLPGQIITGTGEAGSTVVLKDGLVVAGTTTVAGDGTWSISLTLTERSHALTAEESDAAGNIGASAPIVIDYEPDSRYFAAWNNVKNAQGFSTIDGTPVLTTPLSAPATLPQTGVASAQAETLNYYVRFTTYDGSGTTLTLNGDQLFALQNFTFGASQTLNIGSQSSGAGAGKVTFDELKLSLGDAALNPDLFARLASGTAFKEVDVLGYRQSDGVLVSDDSFGLLAGASLTIDQSGVAQYSAQYGAVELQHSSQLPDGSLVAD